MSSLFAPVVAHRTPALAIAGTLFLVAAAGVGSLPSHYVARMVVEAPESGVPTALLQSPPAAQGVEATPGPGTRRWTLHATGRSSQEASSLLTTYVTALRSSGPEGGSPGPETRELQATLQEQERLLAGAKEIRDEALRKVAALDAVAIALKARGAALRREGGGVAGTKRTSADTPHGSGSSRSAASRERPEETNAFRRELEDTVGRLARFAGQLEALKQRYSPSHPEVLRKTVEVEALERRLRELTRQQALLSSLSGEILTSDQTSWDAALAAIQAESSRWGREVARIRSAEAEVASLRTRLLRASAADSQAGGGFRALAPAEVFAAGQPSRSWALGALAVSLCAGWLAACGLHRFARKVWRPGDLPAGPWADTVFCAPRFYEPRAWKRAALPTAFALLPWVAALRLLS